MTEIRVIGFTGTRQGMTDSQRGYIRGILRRHQPDAVHHGDCIGADVDFHRMAQRMGLWTIIHPPSNNRYRAYCGGHHSELRSPKPYMERNDNIVAASDYLLATPKEDHEVIRSGTWATIRRARKAGIPTTIISPKGGELE